MNIVHPTPHKVVSQEVAAVVDYAPAAPGFSFRPSPWQLLCSACFVVWKLIISTCIGAATLFQRFSDDRLVSLNA
jgi:hypothetical protein